MHVFPVSTNRHGSFISLATDPNLVRIFQFLLALVGSILARENSTLKAKLN